MEIRRRLFKFSITCKISCSSIRTCLDAKEMSKKSAARANLRPSAHYCVFKSMRYRCHRKRIDQFASTLVLMPFRLSTLKRSKMIDRIARCDVNYPLCECYKHTHLRYFRSLFSFWCVLTSTVHTNTICLRLRFRFDVWPLSREF